MMSFTSVVSLSTLDGVTGFRITGQAFGDQLGFSVASAGDLNGDGFSDVIIGAPSRDVGGTSSGTAYVLFGRSGGWNAAFDPATLNGTNGFRMDGLAPNDVLGVSVAVAGDLNGDGLSDLVVGATGADPNGQTNAGSAYVVFGRTAGWAPNISLGGLNGGNGFRLDGVAADDLAGLSIASAGDVNGDGLGDLIVGARGSDANGIDSGASYVVFGKRGGWDAALNLGALNGSNGFRLDGAASRDSSGRSVASAGDVNGDGFGDIIIGAVFAEQEGRLNTGASYVVFGKAAGWAPAMNLSTLNGSNGFRLAGVTTGDENGRSVASAGDINGDGFGDIIIGASKADPGGRWQAGVSYVLFGQGGNWGSSIDLAALGAGQGFRIAGARGGDNSGTSVASAGDVNGDGFADLVIGSPGAWTSEASNAGMTHVVFGRADGWGAMLDLSGLNATDGFRLDGIGSDAASGMSAASAGDVDGDGFADLIIGAHAQSSMGAAYVYFSPATGGITRRGTNRKDTLAGGAEADTLHGLDGDDWLQGRLGHDALFGGSGHDTLDGGAGNDTMDGGIENDTYVQHDIGDVIIDSAGDDTLWLLVNAPIAVGIETTRLAGAADSITGTAGADQIVANATRASRIDGADGHDHIWGGPLAHTLLGGAGDDTLRGQDGAARLEGGAGDDHLVVGHLGAVLVELAGQGTDTAWVSVNGYTLPLHVEIARLAGTATQLTGSAGAEQLVANPLLASNLNGGLGDDVLWGSAGADTLNGDWGDDTIRGQGGADQMWGGWGNDHFVILQADVTANEADGQGWDTAWVAADGWTAQPHIEQIMLSGGAGVVHANDQANLVGGNATRANAIIGAGGDDTIFGGGFADTLTGGAGNDVLYGMGGADVFVYAASGWGYDQIAGFTAGLSKLDFRGSGIGFGQLTLTSAGGNTQMEFGGSAILLHGVATLGAGDFLF